MIVSGFGPQSAACQHGAATGQRWILVMYREPGGQYSVNSCGLGGQLGTNGGEALLFEAMTAFGAPNAPSTSEPQPQDPLDLTPWLGGLGWVALVVGVGATLFVVVALLARRRPST